MWKALPSILSKNLPNTHVIETKDLHLDPKAEFFIAGISEAHLLHPENAILIFKESVKHPCDYPAGERTVAVVDAAGGSELLQQVSRTMLPAITCGLASRDTITLSSIDRDSAVITLQRSVHSFDGGVVEPQEIPIHMEGPVDSFLLMAVSAVFFLTGNGNRLRHADFNLEDTNNFQS